MMITKQCSNHQIAHLYEHIYFIELDTVLRMHGLFPVIDYNIDAYTDEGVITFDITAYTVIDLGEIISQATDNFLQNNIFFDIGIRQLENEHACRYIVKDDTNIISILKELNRQPWSGDKMFYVENDLLTIGRKLSPAAATFIVPYPKEIAADIKPMFRLVAGISLNIFVSDIADTHGGFVNTAAFETNSDNDLIASILLTDVPSQIELLQAFKQTKQELVKEKGYARLLSALQSITEMDHPPSNDRTFHDTGVEMNDEKWRTIANRENLDLILKQLRLVVN